ncbi:hypothetical protein [Ursidibacter sp. B-7004-1]
MNNQQSKKAYLDLLDTLDQNLIQASAVIDYMSTDVGENKDFSVNIEVVANMLWTAQTLLSNALEVASKLNQVHKGGK